MGLKIQQCLYSMQLLDRRMLKIHTIFTSGSHMITNKLKVVTSHSSFSKVGWLFWV